MSDLISLQMGACPWAPTDDVKPIEVINHYDAPLTGIIEQHGVSYLFHCLFGHLSAFSVWMYVPLSQYDLESLESVEAEDLDGWYTSVTDGRLLTVALADERGLRHKTEVIGRADLLDLALDSMQQLQTELHREAEALSELSGAPV